MYDIVFMEGNKKYLMPFRHIVLRERVMEQFKSLNNTFIQSDLSTLDHIPISKVYIGFSQGTRYFKKMNSDIRFSDSLKISLGGISAKDVLFYKNDADKARTGDVSKESLESHFTITDKTLNSINKNVLKYLKQHKD